VSRKLIVNDGRRERELLLVGKIVVGRDPNCDVSEADSLLSRRHAEFSVDGNIVVVRDLGSRNGIYVNGARLAEGRLQSGDLIGIGNLKLRYVEDSTPIVVAPELADVDATAVMSPPSQRPAPAEKETEDPDRRSFVAPPAAKSASRSGSIARPVAGTPAPRSAAQPPPPPVQEADDADATALVSAPRPPAPSASTPVKATAPTPPPAPRPTGTPAPASGDDGDQTRIVAPPSLRAAPASASQAGASMTAILGSGTDPSLEPTVDVTHEARVLSIAVSAIADFLGRTSTHARAIEAINALEQDLALAAEGRLGAVGNPVRAASANQIADELDRLMERLRTASSDLL